MEEQKQNQLLDALCKAYPRYKFSLLSTMQRCDKMLLLVNGVNGHINNWGFSNGPRVWWDGIRPISKKLGVFGSIRTLFVLSDNEFVLYAPALGIRGGVFGDMKKPISYEVYGDEDHQYYAGKCQKIEDVINYLQKKRGTY